MTGPIVSEHRHIPIYRVVRRSWADPLDSSWSQSAPDNRWNTPEFPALYCCCSPAVARAVTLDIFRYSGIELSDLRPAFHPQLVEIEWRGWLVDLTSPEDLAAAEYPAEYPAGSPKTVTRASATAWHRDGREGVLWRSASLARQGLQHWRGNHQRWSELAIFVRNSAVRPLLLRRREDLEWLKWSPPATTAS